MEMFEYIVVITSIIIGLADRGSPEGTLRS